MYYTGTFQETNGQFTADLRVQRHSKVVPGIVSVFGLDNIGLKLKGTSNGKSAAGSELDLARFPMASMDSV
jgi:hypothetical protein